MQTNTKISVIIPVYNGEKYIVQCIENMLCQSHKNLEIIVVNDGSTDKTSEIAEKYPIKLIHQQNSGVSVARNTGIEHATGDFIHFMDVDDLVNLDFYEKMISASLATDADMVCSEMVHERLPYLNLQFDAKQLAVNIEEKMQLTNVKQQGACYKYLFRTDFLRKHKLKFEKEFISAEDLMFSFQAVYFANKIVSVPQAVYYYKHREQSAMTTKTKAHRQKKRECRKKATNFCKEFAKKHHFEIALPTPQKTEYKLFGIPLLKKVIFYAGKTRWYFLGICILQRKPTNA